MDTYFTDEELLKIFNTTSFTGGNVKEGRRIDDHTMYLVMFNEPDLIFEWHDCMDWSIRTAKNFIKD